MMSVNLFMMPENLLKAHLEARLEVGNGGYLGYQFEFP